MPSEVITYMSVMVIGITAFGFFSGVLITFSDQADEITAEATVANILPELGIDILELIARGQILKGSSANTNSITISLFLDLPAKINGNGYSITTTTDANNMVSLISKFSNNLLIPYEFALGINNSTVEFYGSTYSSASFSGKVTYNSFQNGTEKIEFLNSL